MAVRVSATVGLKVPTLGASIGHTQLERLCTAAKRDRNLLILAAQGFFNGGVVLQIMLLCYH